MVIGKFMKKIFVLLTLISVLLVSTAVGAVIAAPDGLASKKPIKTIRIDNNILQKSDLAPVDNGGIIVPTPNLLNKVSYWLKGCKSTQKMNDSAAYECSPGVAKKLIANGDAREDRIFQKHDLEADVQINADDVWDMDPSITGEGVRVAILDTGVESTHIELSNSIVATRNFIARASVIDRDGHGTHVSGIVTADGVHEIGGNYATGVAPGADIIMGKVCDAYGCYESSIIAGIEWAVKRKADVLSLSLGGVVNYEGHCDGDSLAAKVNWAVEQGLVVVVSSGNDNAGVSSPACASGAIAVGAVDKLNTRALFSNYGSALDIVAPGVDILSTYSCIAAGNCGYYWYASMSGTSMSAPHVAGTVALILQKNPSYSVDNVKEALYNTAVNPGVEDWDQYYGHGRVDALAAVNYQSGCLSHGDCEDNNICTTDICDTTAGTCSNVSVDDGTVCGANVICCGGICSSATCSTDTECNDNNACTMDICDFSGTCSASCSNTEIIICIDEDGCCPEGCTNELDSNNYDSDCPVEDLCNTCLGGACNDRCHRKEVGTLCPDCQ